jgi:hypothetical protein
MAQPSQHSVASTRVRNVQVLQMSQPVPTRKIKEEKTKRMFSEDE